MTQRDLTAQSAFDTIKKSLSGIPLQKRSKFVCAYRDCQTFAVHHWGNLESVTTRDDSSYSSRSLGKCPTISVSHCEACGRESIYIGSQIVLPADSDAPAATTDLPSDLLADYEEARAILPRSPRGAAALLRLVIQKLLPHLGATKKAIDAGIGELVAQGKIKRQIQQALDTVRVIGNESVHPGEMDLRDDRETALALFRIINLIVETEITEPKRLETLYASLPQSKLRAIERRDGKAAEHTEPSETVG